MADAPAHMTADEFRAAAHALVDWIADYHEHLGDRPVVPDVTPGQVGTALPAEPPAGGGRVDELIRWLDDVVVPATVHWQHPRFFAYFPANVSYPAMLGDLVSAGLGVQGMLWATAPAATEVEAHVLGWLADLCDLPYRTGAIQDSASSATLCAVVAAREAATSGQVNAAGASGRRLAVYASDQAHSSLEKAVRVTGVGSANLREVSTRDDLSLDPTALAHALADDRAAGITPVMVQATVGTTATGAVDRLEALGAVCRQAGVWLHVDAAWAGSAAVCPEHRWLLEGLEHADSYVFNPHKWLLVNFDLSALYVARPERLTAALAIMPEYLKNAASAQGALDYRDWQIPLGRRFRALKLWFVLHHYGVEGLRAHIRQHVTWAERLAAVVDGDPNLEQAYERSLALVTVRHVAGEEATVALAARLAADRRFALTSTKVRDRTLIRVAIGATATTAADVELLAGALGRSAAEVG